MLDSIGEGASLSNVPSTIGRYLIAGRLATGGMAEIFLGKVTGPSGFERPVVVKRILPHLARQPELVAMFLDEARIAAQIHHPNVVRVEDLGQDGPELYMVMEYLAGENCARLLGYLSRQQSRLPIWLSAHIAAEVASALEAAHQP